MALMATIDCYEPDDLASKVIPSMSFTMLDKEKYVLPSICIVIMGS